MVNLPRVATLEFRMKDYTKKLSDLERRTDRLIQQQRGSEGDLESPEPVTADLAEGAPLFTEGASTNSNESPTPAPGLLPAPSPANSASNPSAQATQALASPPGPSPQYGSGAPVGAPVSGGDTDPIHGDADPRTTRQIFEDLCGITPPPEATPPSTSTSRRGRSGSPGAHGRDLEEPLWGIIFCNFRGPSDRWN